MATYVLKPRVPIRAFVVSAAASLIGAIFLVLALSNNWHVIAVILGVLILLAGIALLVVSVFSMRTMQVHVALDEAGYTITGPKVNNKGKWASVTKAVSADDGARLILHHGPVERTHIWAPLGANDEQMQSLMADVSKHLDADRGYRNY